MRRWHRSGCSTHVIFPHVEAADCDECRRAEEREEWEIHALEMLKHIGAVKGPRP